MVDVLCLLADINDAVNVVKTELPDVEFTGNPSYLNDPEIYNWFDGIFKFAGK